MNLHPCILRLTFREEIWEFKTITKEMEVDKTTTTRLVEKEGGCFAQIAKRLIIQ